MNKQQFTIRPAKLTDLRAIHTLLRSRSIAPPNRPQAERLWVRDHVKVKQIILIAEQLGKIVGFVMGETATSHVAISHLVAVAPKARRRGIGHQLQLTFEKEAYRRGARCILAYAVVKSAASEKLFRSARYTPGSLVREYQKFL